MKDLKREKGIDGKTKSDCPSQDQVDLLKVKNLTARAERDMFLATACLLAQVCVIAIVYYKGKFERYMEHRIEQE